VLVKEKEDRLLLWQELRRLVLRGNAAAAAAWVRSCVAELGRPAAGGSGGAAAGAAAADATADQQASRGGARGS
jgi:hypothetical protein